MILKQIALNSVKTETAPGICLGVALATLRAVTLTENPSKIPPINFDLASRIQNRLHDGYTFQSPGFVNPPQFQELGIQSETRIGHFSSEADTRRFFASHFSQAKPRCLILTLAYLPPTSAEIGDAEYHALPVLINQNGSAQIYTIRSDEQHVLPAPDISSLSVLIWSLQLETRRAGWQDPCHLWASEYTFAPSESATHF